MEKPGLSRRERQIMDGLYTLGEATVGEVMERMPDPPSYSAVRATLRVLEEKGHVKHRQDGPRYLYLPTVSRDKAQSTALKHLVGTFFGGSVEQAVMALLSLPETKLSEDQLEILARQVRQAEEEGR
ncbi:MAG TPA: BlaI/MecI/CopY family transcriptional regulator [Longimicrobiales bacterium]|nr:BlaI/MecI/CopY family transcriptional regulator [Longimicrobiales bacterium]